MFLKKINERAEYRRGEFKKNIVALVPDQKFEDPSNLLSLARNAPESRNRCTKIVLNIISA